MWGSVIIAAVMLLSTAAMSASPDCAGMSGKPRDKCLRALDAENHKHAKHGVLMRPTTLYRVVDDAAQVVREQAGRPHINPLHFSEERPRSLSGARAALGLSDRRQVRGYYSCKFVAGTPTSEAKVAGGHGRKREVLVDTKYVRQQNCSSFTPF